MELSVLAIDKDNIKYEFVKSEWEKTGFPFERAYSMREAIEKLKKESFYLIGINADSIDYKPHLKVLRDIAQCPIMILTSDFSTKELVEAHENGADMFSPWREDTQFCVRLGLAIAQRFYERGKAGPPKIISAGSLVLIPPYHRALYEDSEIVLTKTEFDLLYYLMVNRGRVLSHKQIYRYVWHGEYDETAPDVLWTAIKRIRDKIRRVTQEHEYIENIRGVGYRFPAEFDEQV